MTTKAPEIKPCPFCGKKPTVETNMDKKVSSFFFRIECLNKKCGIMCQISKRWHETHKPLMDDVVSRWNTRN